MLRTFLATRSWSFRPAILRPFPTLRKYWNSLPKSAPKPPPPAITDHLFGENIHVVSVYPLQQFWTYFSTAFDDSFGGTSRKSDDTEQHSSSSPSDTSPFYEQHAKTLEGEDYDFSKLKGKVVLVVNVASACIKFTPQYKDLQQLYDKYHSQGLEILGFPCNQFAEQEQGTPDQIRTFVSKNYGITFPIMEKVEVNGDHAHPVYQYLKHQKSQFMMERVKWNFEKFLIDKDGKVVERFTSLTTPRSMEEEIKTMLAK